MPNRFVVLMQIAFTLVACNRSNNLLLGEVRGKLGSHDVTVTDCYRTNAPQPVATANKQSWEPCRDASVVIDSEELTVNGRSYGTLSSGDSILVDHGVVSVKHRSAGERAQR
jgi:hypothetical protein